MKQKVDTEAAPKSSTPTKRTDVGDDDDSDARWANADDDDDEDDEDNVVDEADMTPPYEVIMVSSVILCRGDCRRCVDNMLCVPWYAPTPS